MTNTIKTELLLYSYRYKHDYKSNTAKKYILDNNIKMYELETLYDSFAGQSFYDALCNASNDDVKQLIPTFITFSEAEKSIQILNMYSSIIDLDEVFDRYLYLFDCFCCDGQLYYDLFYDLEEICEYMISNKINMNKYIDRIIVICIKNRYTQLHDIEGIELTPEQEEYYNRYVKSEYDTFESIIINHKPKSYANLYALVNCKYDAKVDKFMYHAYRESNTVYINKYKHIPDFKCLIRSCSSIIEHKYTPNNDMDIIDRIYKLNIHELTTKNKKYNENEYIKLNEILIGFSGELHDEYCTVKQYIEQCCINHCDSKTFPDDVMKYHYVQNTLFINIFTRLNKYDVYINFGNLVYYVLDNYML